MNYKRYISNFSISLSITLILFIAVEIFITFVLGYRSFKSGNKDCKVLNEKYNFSTYKPNCKLINKNWENDIKIEYHFNEFGRRDGEINFISTNSIKIASIGDSFTMGAMVPINENYNYSGFKTIKNNKYLVHNYGVAGEQLDNIINKINFKKDLTSEYDFILYGLTPNDFFDYLKKTNKNLNINKSENFIFGKIKSKVIRLSISRFILHKLLSNDSFYYSIYLKQKPYSGYLNSELDENWTEALRIFEKKVGMLPSSSKPKLKIILLPQRAEVVGYRLGTYKDSFRKKVMESCKKIKIDCYRPSLNKLSLIDQSHFPVDGHLTIEGNKVIGNDLINWTESWPTINFK